MEWAQVELDVQLRDKERSMEPTKLVKLPSESRFTVQLPHLRSSSLLNHLGEQQRRTECLGPYTHMGNPKKRFLAPCFSLAQP